MGIEAGQGPGIDVALDKPIFDVFGEDTSSQKFVTPLTHSSRRSEQGRIRKLLSVAALTPLLAFTHDNTHCEMWVSPVTPGFEFAPPVEEEDRLDVLTFNIHKGSRGKEKVARAIKAQKPEIVFLNEATRPVAEYIADESGLTEEAHVWTRVINGDKFGNVILTNLNLLRYDIHPLPGKDGYEPRALVAALIEREGKIIIAANTHLINKEPGMFGKRRKKERLQQAAEVRQIVREYADKADIIIFGGDYNTRPDSKVHAVLTTHLTDPVSDRGLHVESFPFHDAQYDYVFLDDTDLFTPYRITVGGEDASDHCFVQTTLAENPTSTSAPRNKTIYQRPRFAESKNKLKNTRHRPVKKTRVGVRI